MTTQPESQRLSLEQYRERYPGQQVRRVAYLVKEPFTVEEKDKPAREVAFIAYNVPSLDQSAGEMRHYGYAVRTQVSNCYHPRQRRVIVWNGGLLAFVCRLEFVDREWLLSTPLPEAIDKKHSRYGMLTVWFTSPEQFCDWYVQQAYKLDASEKPVTAPERQPAEHLETLDPETVRM